MNPQAVIMLTFIGALAFPDYSLTLKPYILLFLGGMMFFLSSNIEVGDMKDVISKPVPLAVMLFVNFVIMPMLTYVISLPFNDPQITLGFVILGTSSMAVASSFWTHISKGKVHMAIGYTSISSLFVVFWMPLVISFFGATVSINPLDILVSLFMSVVFPVILAQLVRRLWSDFRKYSHFSIIPMVFLLYASVGSNSGAIFSNTTILGVSVIQPVLGFIAGYIIAKVFDIDLTSAMLSLGIKNMGISLAIAITYFGDMVALPSAATIPSQVVLPILYVWLLEWKRKQWKSTYQSS